MHEPSPEGSGGSLWDFLELIKMMCPSFSFLFFSLICPVIKFALSLSSKETFQKFVDLEQVQKLICPKLGQTPPLKKKKEIHP